MEEDAEVREGAYETVPLGEMVWKADLDAFTYECPCGDLFQITMQELDEGEDIGACPSCSLYIVVEYDLADVIKAREIVAEAKKKCKVVEAKQEAVAA